ncbi:hypothetical protein BDZ97DRAFT_851959 [Flammula alnicola]|nr:hypothetical protein BDZ97DRAFT_851959 [Flammula alnicola]
MQASEFQTPHPTLEAQSQVFKLPSSSPQHSPEPLSPVPAVITSSRKLRENFSKQDKFLISPAATSTPWNRHSSKNIAATTLTSGQLPQIPLSRTSRSRSRRHRAFRSQSRSSSNSNSHSNSSRASSKEPDILKSKTRNRQKYATHESKLKHAQSLSSLNPAQSNSNAKSEAKPTPLSKAKKLSRIHGQGQAFLPLASPFVSRASSPTEPSSTTHISAHAEIENKNQHKDRAQQHQQPNSGTKNGKRAPNPGVLADTLFDPNMPPPSRPGAQSHFSSSQSHHHHKHGSQSTHTSPKSEHDNLQQPNATKTTKKRSTTRGAENRVPLQIRARGGDDEDGREYQRERRPSAPSSLHLPRKPRLPLRLSGLGPGRGATSAGRQTEAVDTNTNPKSGLHIALDQFLLAGSIDKPQVIPPTPAAEPEAEVAGANANANVHHRHPPRPLPGPVIRPSASMHDLQSHNYDNEHNHYLHRQTSTQQAEHHDDDDARTAWMHARSGVDFNRPPSQMEVGAGVGPFGGRGFGYPEFEDKFFSSSSSSEGEGEQEEGQAKTKTKKSAAMRPNTRAGFGRSGPAGSGLGLGAPFGFGFGFGDTLDLDLEKFGEDAWGISTPFKVGFGSGLEEEAEQEAEEKVERAGLARNRQQAARSEALALSKDEKALAARRTTSLPSLHLSVLSGSSSPVGNVLVRSLSYSDLGLGCRDGIVGKEGMEKDEEDEDQEDEDQDEDEDGEEDMELTGSATSRYIPLDGRREVRDRTGEAKGREGMMSWITDSLISAPTAYLEWKAKKVAGGNGTQDEEDEEKEEEEEQAVEERRLATLSSSTGATRLSSPFRLSEPDACNEDPPEPFSDQSTRSESLDNPPADPNINANGSGKMAKRTRSGTIVPANAAGPSAGVPPGARRTRSGTIVGPLPIAPPPAFGLPVPPSGAGGGGADGITGTAGMPGYGRVGAGPTRTRSGTIIASASVVKSSAADSGPGMNGRHGRARSGSVLRMMPVQNLPPHKSRDRPEHSEGDVETQTQPSENKPGADADAEHEQVVECYADSLYLPPTESSPDQLDFLRFASIAEGEEGDEEEWRIAEEPPSPEIPKAKRGKGILRGRTEHGASGRGSGWVLLLGLLVRGGG